ncbi:DUF4254 domain-containing protein [Desulfovibrio litoralis]|uniref:DUF4254 domain-containing protein n=1 Tax=Desulfovibrio litoralis DSM 11393 TaxID=1121455 RepID=A0A1M7SNK5_9BACT|nr:DUF4254 domain-containing protein [Desulfovibrio litoralis]SHN60067.1 Protein of unknown function [Desulfovibrio litoralis DSM 11393]
MKQQTNDISQNLTALLETIKSSLKEQCKTVELWHQQLIDDPYIIPPQQNVSFKNLQETIIAQHYMNFTLWHIEDEARRKDVDASIIADCKYRIDVCNQKRNDRMEAVDFCLLNILKQSQTEQKSEKYNTEPPALAIDRLSILALKIYHMQEQIDRQDVDKTHKESCQNKLNVLIEQREDISLALLELIKDYYTGKKQMKVYYQFKMYNDPNLNPALYNTKKKQ